MSSTSPTSPTSPASPTSPTPWPLPLRRALGGLLALLALVLATAVLLGSGGGAAAQDAARWKPPADTIVGVSGSAVDGFTISRYDGSKLFPPTDSEARAECGEYDRRVQRVRCRVEVATWYRDLGDLKRSLRWARSQ